MMSFPNYKFIGLAILLWYSMLLTSSLAETSNKGRTKKPAPITTQNCDLSLSSHIDDFCQAYYRSNCQATTTEAPALPVYDCTIISRLIDPLFKSDTMTFASTVLKEYANMVKPKPKAKGTIFDSVFEATKMLCSRLFANSRILCDSAASSLSTNVEIDEYYRSACARELDSMNKFYEPKCMEREMKQGEATCSTLFDNGCLTGSAFNSTCVKNLAGKQLN